MCLFQFQYEIKYKIKYCFIVYNQIKVGYQFVKFKVKNLKIFEIKMCYSFVLQKREKNREIILVISRII